MMRNSTKEKRIKKFGKIKVWPSVCVVIVSFGIIITALLGTSRVLATILSDNILAVNYVDADKVLRSVSTNIQRNGRIDVSQIEEILNNKQVYSLHIYDRNKYSLYQRGNEITKKKRNMFNLNLDKNKKLYISFNKNTLKIEKEYVNLVRTIDKDYLNDEIVFSLPVWIQYEYFGYSIQIKTALVLTKRIAFYGSMLFVLIMIITVFPLCFLLANVIKNSSINIKLQKLLFTDIQTGASNWICFEQTAIQIINKYRNRRKKFAIVDIEVVGYSNLLAFFGSNEGIHLLEKYNRYLLSKLSSRNEFVAHIPKSNYVLLLCGDEKQDMKRRVEILLNSFSFERKSNYLGFRAGVYILPDGRTSKGLAERRKLSIADCYNNAVMARHSIGEYEGNYQVVMFNNALLDEQLWEHKVEERIDEAISKREFKVYFQPKYNPINEKLVGAEALIRWVSEEEGLVSPIDFIPIYERNGLIKKIDDYMLDTVARYQAKWIQMGRRVVPVSVNVSRAHFAEDNLAEHIRDIVDRYKVPHEYIEIELTESAFFDDKDIILKIVEKIQSYGFEVSMDDFGTGYSSLNSLKDLDLDVLKLDAEFFRGSMDESRAKIVISDAIRMAKHLGMKVVAEGIEKKEQVQFLADAGCDMIQGFYYSKPVPAADFTTKMEKIKS